VGNLGCYIMRKVGNLGFYIMMNFVVYMGHLVLQEQLKSRKPQ
jgi:hypothetical protein